eukprot:CAMPEP_0176273226 /NCGR_PEP_ID=MMETSP0121_2-20121125/46114_1 /TAXON_ID=160619 /ORGANISM="Kryptoperidinium foliaceum, Strain CCMP 1326" /LENGTH=163 /DNA_ID=CAMNT_0017613411 /DNA_START=71 /DNA_END=559 /DNA_ORIENTATION=+
MATALVEAAPIGPLEAEVNVSAVGVRFKVSGMEAFELELDRATAVRDVKKLAKDMCSIEPEHMRLIYYGRVLKESDTLECYDADSEMAVQVMFTAGHTGLMGGSKGQVQQRNPFSTPVRGLPGSKGNRSSRMSGRLGGNALIRKYGILMKRQEFREKAEQIGF